MDFIRTYGNLIKKYAPEHPVADFRMIKAGLVLEKFRTKHLAAKKLPGAYQYLNTYAVTEVLEALRHPEKSVWANILAPVEILQCFGVHTLSIECLSSFLSGFISHCMNCFVIFQNYRHFIGKKQDLEKTG